MRILLRRLLFVVKDACYKLPRKRHGFEYNLVWIKLTQLNNAATNGQRDSFGKA